jgi:hypothetical protein
MAFAGGQPIARRARIQPLDESVQKAAKQLLEASRLTQTRRDLVEDVERRGLVRNAPGLLRVAPTCARSGSGGIGFRAWFRASGLGARTNLCRGMR